MSDDNTPACSVAFEEWEARKEVGYYAAEPWVYDVIIDAAGPRAVQHALKEARGICGGCPIAAHCLLVDNADEQWAQWIRGVDHRKPPTTRGHCGTDSGHSAHVKNREHPCDPCRTAHNTKKRIAKARAAEMKAAAARAAKAEAEKQEAADQAKARLLPGIPDDIRQMHATFTRLRKAESDIPHSIREGERIYQALRQRARRARRDAA